MNLPPILTTDELTNRDFQLPSDKWYQIAPIGTFPHPTGAMQVIDTQACEAMNNRFQQEASKPNFPGLLVDFDHQSHDQSLPSTAAGWITALQNRADGLWAKIRWSDLGEQSVKGGRFRLVSPVWNRSDCDQWKESVDGKETLFLRPRRLDRVAVTNDPNISGMVPLSNRAVADPVIETDDEPVKQIAMKNYGTSDGARKGWETRRGGAGAVKADKPKGIIKKIAKKPSVGVSKPGAKANAAVKPAAKSGRKVVSGSPYAQNVDPKIAATHEAARSKGQLEKDSQGTTIWRKDGQSVQTSGAFQIKPRSNKTFMVEKNGEQLGGAATKTGAYAMAEKEHAKSANAPAVPKPPMKPAAVRPAFAPSTAPDGKSYLGKNIFHMHFHNRTKTTSGDRLIAHKNRRSVSNHTA